MFVKQVCAVLIIISSIKSDENVIDYYEKLITEQIERSATYQFPKDASAYRPNNTKPIEYGTYDFVVIGAGSAGSVVASRLSEVQNWRVLLMEAGKEENNFTDIPSMSIYTAKLEYNWGFNSTPQTTCCLASGGICSYPRGKAVGGTSVINSLIYSRGSRYDFDKWGRQGNEGWFYDDVLKYFKKSENSNVNGSDEYHGRGGYLDVNYHSPISKKVDIFLAANEELSVPILDPNGKTQLGSSPNQFTTTRGRRMSSAKAFLTPARNRTNLVILPNSYVVKLLISNFSKVEGVLFSHKNVLYVVSVKREVILSAGVIGSPQILMLSGVGPERHLSRHQIPVIKNLAIGENFHDHVAFSGLYFLTTQPEPSFLLRNAIKQYLNGTGPLTISTNPQAVTFLQLNSNRDNLTDLEIVFIPSIKMRGFDIIKNDNASQYQNRIFQIAIVLLHPKTRGGIYLKSNDPYDYPIIDAKCLSDSNNEDIRNIYEGILKVLEILDAEPFKKLSPRLIPNSACVGRAFLSKDYWTCVIRQTAMNAYHGGGTCRMGPSPFEGDVVDNKLKVHGIDNLRVADASILPITLSAHTNAPAIMIGERAADFIKNKHLN